MSGPKRILVVEDGLEYTDAFQRLSGSQVIELVRTANLDEARAAIVSAPPDAIFLDVVFDRIPEEDLAGDLEPLIVRFGGDRAQAIRHLAQSQGFYILSALSGVISDVPVVIAYDFAAEPRRLKALRRRFPTLVGLADGAPITEALRLLVEGSADP